jgi:MFS transporter, PHS family, inorganic phosphate transporter
MMAAVFAMQGLGQLLFVTLGFKNQLGQTAGVADCNGICQTSVDRMWRILIGFGGVPACMALYCTLSALL